MTLCPNSDVKHFFLSCSRHSDRGLIVVILYYFHIFKSETKKNSTLLLLELLAVTWIPCILRHSISILYYALFSTADAMTVNTYLTTTIPRQPVRQLPYVVYLLNFMIAAKIVNSYDLAKWVEYLPMVQETWVQSQVELYQRLKKWYLIPPCLNSAL